MAAARHSWYSSGSVTAISPDGTLCGGYVGTGSNYKPVRWKNGQIEFLTCPETTYTGQEAYAGFVVKSMSADGTCVGADWTDQLGCYWDKQGNVVYYGESTLIIQDDWLMSDYGTQAMISPTDATSPPRCSIIRSRSCSLLSRFPPPSYMT